MNRNSAWDLIEAMGFDTSDSPEERPERGPKRPPPIPVKTQRPSGPPRFLPGATNAPFTRPKKEASLFGGSSQSATSAPPRRSKTPTSPFQIGPDTPLQRSAAPSAVTEPGESSWDVYVNGAGVYKVPAPDEQTAKDRAAEWLASGGDPEHSGKSFSPNSFQAVRTEALARPNAWDTSDVEPSAPSPLSSKRPPPMPIRIVKVKDASGRPVSRPRLPGVRERKKSQCASEGSGVGSMGTNGPMGRDERKEAFKEAILAMVHEVVRKKEGGGGYALYAPNKGKKKSPKPVGEFPTRLAAKNAELARFPPKDPEQLKKIRARLDKIKKDPKKRAAAERRDLLGSKASKKSGAPVRTRKKRKESLVRLMAKDLHERLFHEDEVPGSPWDERMAALHPDAISSDRRLHMLHRGMEKASIGAFGDAHRGLSKVLRGTARVNPGDISFDGERKKTFMPVMLDCDGFEIGPIHLYVDGGHIKIEVSKEARDAISQLEPDTARDVRGGLMTFEEEHLPGIDGAQKAWAARDSYLDKLHGRLERQASGLSGVEHHLMKGLLTKGGKRK